MPPITETEQLAQLREDFDKMAKNVAQISIDIRMIVAALKGNTDLNPADTGVFGAIKWLKGEVLNMKRERERVRGMFTGGVAVGSVAGGVVAFLITFLINHFTK